MLLFLLPAAVPIPGAFEHPGCRKKEGISERLHWVRKKMQEDGRHVGASQKVVVKKIRPLFQWHSFCALRAGVGFASVGMGCSGHSVNQRERICGDL